MTSAPGGRNGRRDLRSSSGTVRAESDGAHVVLVLEGALDRAAASTLLESVHHHLNDEPARIDIDLTMVSAFAADGAAALAQCRELCAELPAGLHYRTEGGAGQLAVLSAFEREP